MINRSAFTETEGFASNLRWKGKCNLNDCLFGKLFVLRRCGDQVNEICKEPGDENQCLVMSKMWDGGAATAV